MKLRQIGEYVHIQSSEHFLALNTENLRVLI